MQDLTDKKEKIEHVMISSKKLDHLLFIEKNYKKIIDLAKEKKISSKNNTSVKNILSDVFIELKKDDK